MVDPLTVATAVAQVAKSAREVSFVFDHVDIFWEAKIVNEAKVHLTHEIRQLEDVCDTVDKHLRRLPGTTAEPDDEQLLRGIQMQLAACDRSMGRLVEAVKKINPDLNISVKQVV